MSNRKGKPIMRRRTSTLNNPPSSLNMSLEDAKHFVHDYKRSEGMRERTLFDYIRIADYFIEWLAKHCPDIVYINEITSGIIRDYINYLLYEHINEQTGNVGLSPVTINVRLRNMSAFFNVLHAEKVINRNPMAMIKRLKTDEDTFEPLSDIEIERLLKVLDTDEYAQFRDLVSIYLILDTGIRVSEMYDLKIDHVNFKARAIYLPGDVTKNRKNRILPLSNEVINLLMELISEVQYNWETDLVFVSNFGEPYNPSSFRRRLDNYKRKAGINKRVTPHGLRHQFCRDYVLNGGDIFTLQRIAGHSDIATTRKYIQFTDDDLKASHAQFSPVAVRKMRKRR